MSLANSEVIYEPECLDYESIINIIIEQWRSWAAKTNTTKMCLGISGGKDSAVAAALACRTFGSKNVFGILMPNGEQADIADSKAICKFLGIQYITINLSEPFGSLLRQMRAEKLTPSSQTITNLPARLRMSTTFAVAQSIGAKVINTCNLSEDIIGWNTLFGDDCGAYAPLKGLTCCEVREMAKYMGLPSYIWEKAPSDGLCGETDENKFGFSYYVLDTYIRTGICHNWEIELKIRQLYKKNSFKTNMVRIPCPNFCPQIFEKRYFINYLYKEEQNNDWKTNSEDPTVGYC